jgi:hypothetical protein
MKVYLKWEDIRVGKWDSNPFTWDDVAIIEEILSGGTDGYNPYDVYREIEKKSDDKKKKIVKIIAKLEGKEFSEEKYKKKKVKVTIKDVKILFESLNIKVNV